MTPYIQKRKSTVFWPTEWLKWRGPAAAGKPRCAPTAASPSPGGAANRGVGVGEAAPGCAELEEETAAATFRGAVAWVQITGEGGEEVEGAAGTAGAGYTSQDLKCAYWIQKIDSCFFFFFLPVLLILCHAAIIAFLQTCQYNQMCNFATIFFH